MGYRRSNFDPNAAWGEPGPPLRPYNWVQWTGVGFLVFGLIGMLAEFAARVGWISFLDGDFIPFVSFMPLGAVLINSRREPNRVADPATLPRRKIIAIVVLGVAVALGVAIVSFDFGPSR